MIHNKNSFALIVHFPLWLSGPEVKMKPRSLGGLPSIISQIKKETIPTTKTINANKNFLQCRD